METLLPNEKEFKDRLDAVSKKFEETRISWDKRLDECNDLFKDFENYVDMNVLINSYRHKLISYLHGPLAKAQRQFYAQRDRALQTVIINLKTKYNLKLNTERERKAIIDANVTVLNELESELNNQEAYIEHLIKHIDKLGYALKMNTDINMVSMGATLK